MRHLEDQAKENFGCPVLDKAGGDRYIVEILWHRRETRRQIEKTNINLVHFGETGLLD